MIVALAGGVGAARLLRGMVREIEPSSLTVVVNTGDDIRLHGLHISPDLDTITYTLAEAINAQQGWGLEGESWAAMDALERYRGVTPPGSGAAATWFRLGDRDLATHLYRTQRLSEGAPLSMITSEITAAWGLGLRLLPMTDDGVETRVTVVGEGEIGFQEYFVGRRHEVPISSVRFAGIETATPAPGVLAALGEATRVVICPSNPIVSVGPVLAVPGLADAVRSRRDDCVAISPIVAGRAIKGPADRMLSELGHDPSVVGVARLYRDCAGTLVIDTADAGLAGAVEAEGMRCIVAPTVMHTIDDARRLAATVLAA